MTEEKASEMTVNGDGKIVDQTPEATWDAFCDPGEVKDMVVDFGPRFGKMVVRYRPFLSFDEHTKISEQFKMGEASKRDTRGFMIAILERIMVAPKIESDKHRRVVMGARFSLLNKMLMETIGSEADEMEAIREDLGE